MDVSESDIIDINGTRSNKFSRHLIVVFNNAVFKNNQECGTFVVKMCDSIREITKMGRYCCLVNQSNSNDNNDNNDINSELDKLFVYTDDTSKCRYNRVLFIDEAVYTRNRCFRLIYSAKKKHIDNKKARYLTFMYPQKRNIKSLKYKCSDNDKYKDWLDTLVCHVNVNDNTRIISFPGQYYTYSRSQASMDDNIFSNDNMDQGFFNHYSQQHSPFPNLDEYMAIFIKKWGYKNAPWFQNIVIQPKNHDELIDTRNKNNIRLTKWKVIKDNNDEILYLYYYLVGNRFCMNIGRNHKSNGIYFKIDFNKGYMTQKCHDHMDCFKFESPPIYLPNDIIQFKNNNNESDNDDDDLFEINDTQFEQEMIKICDESVKQNKIQTTNNAASQTNYFDDPEFEEILIQNVDKMEHTLKHQINKENISPPKKKRKLSTNNCNDINSDDDILLNFHLSLHCN